MWARAVGRTCEEEGSQSGAPLGASPETEGADMTLTEETLMVRGVRGDENGVERVRDGVAHVMDGEVEDLMDGVAHVRDGVEYVRDGEVEDLLDGLENGVEDGVDVTEGAGDMTCQVC